MSVIAFWIFASIMAVVGLIIFIIRKNRFIDELIITMTIAFAFVFDLIFCKQLRLYYYTNNQNLPIYTLWAALFIYPTINLVFISLLPREKKRVPVYIVLWAILLTVFELLLFPLKIVTYSGWRIIPWSSVVYLITFVWTYFYLRHLEKRTCYFLPK